MGGLKDGRELLQGGKPRLVCGLRVHDVQNVASGDVRLQLGDPCVLGSKLAFNAYKNRRKIIDGLRIRLLQSLQDIFGIFAADFRADAPNLVLRHLHCEVSLGVVLCHCFSHRLAAPSRRDFRLEKGWVYGRRALTNFPGR